MLTFSIIFSGAVLGFFLIFLIQSKVQKSTSDPWLMFCLGFSASLLLFYYDNMGSRSVLAKPFQIFGFLLPLLNSPILYFYIKTLAFGLSPNPKQILLHSLPYLLISLIFFANYHSINISNGFPHYASDIHSVVIFLTTTPIAISSGIYSFLSLKVLIQYQRSLSDNYSFTEEITLNWLKWIVLSNLLFFLVIFFIIKFGVNWGLFTYQNLFEAVGILLTIYVLLFGYFGLKQTTTFANFNYNAGILQSENPKESYRNSGLKEEDIERIFRELETHIEQNKPFFDENLNLFTLAQQVGVTTNQLSQVINQKTSSNFFNYINRYRIEAVKQKLKDPAFAHYSILAIGFECGFRSKSSFNKIFKDLEGITPSEFQKNQKI
jgi:AraC-like DNA-binding protein